ncbi:hypothetical protein [Frankia nepalensis]|uniref:Solute-binding protein family 5 domain-containing protein n=2 Tax=Frankia nepalensis TaxID=1836974 RepID=A0A937UN08_9ACTN|nr:hypothetical protein [Frankia nepalensis]MBL7629384.1 hypothetical protein [Frankia nepalensis]
MTVSDVPASVDFYDVSELAALRRTHDFDAATSSAFFGDPEPRLYTAFHGSSAANLSGINDPELNQALLDGRTATSEPDRKVAYDKVQARLTELAPVAFFIRAEPAVIAGKKVSGLVQYGLGSLLPSEIWLQK